MSSGSPPGLYVEYLGSPQHKRREHAEAQARYRKRNLESTRASARERMARLRAKTTSAAQIEETAEKRRQTDADGRELKRRQKFVAKYGHDMFLEVYLPQYQIRGTKHLPGLRLDLAVEQARKKARMKRCSKKIK